MEELKTVKVVVYVDGEYFAAAQSDVPARCWTEVAFAALAQIEDPNDELYTPTDAPMEEEPTTFVGVAP